MFGNDSMKIDQKGRKESFFSVLISPHWLKKKNFFKFIVQIGNYKP